MICNVRLCLDCTDAHHVLSHPDVPWAADADRLTSDVEDVRGAMGPLMMNSLFPTLRDFVLFRGPSMQTFSSKICWAFVMIRMPLV